MAVSRKRPTRLLVLKGKSHIVRKNKLLTSLAKALVVAIAAGGGLLLGGVANAATPASSEGTDTASPILGGSPGGSGGLDLGQLLGGLSGGGSGGLDSGPAPGGLGS